MSSCDPKCSSMEGAEQDTDEEQESDETEDSNIRKVLILYVGGTIGMKKNEDGVYEPAPNALTEEISFQPSQHEEECTKQGEQILRTDDGTIAYKIVEYDPLLDSSNATLADWIRIAEDVKDNYEHYDGFLVLHGTDTLAYGGSILSFLLQGLQKPVILTGAQISIFEIRQSARENFLISLILAGCYHIPEVAIFFANKLLRGNRTVKYSSELLEGFVSPNYPPLADVNVHIRVNAEYIRKPCQPSFVVRTILNPNVGVIALFPTVTLHMIESIFEPPTEGVVLQTYGSGNFPSMNTELLQYLKEKIEDGVIVVNISQCLHGSVSNTYATGKVMQDIGVVPGYDMTVEAAWAKMCYVLSFCDLTIEQKKEMLATNICGELTIADDKA